MKGNRTDKNRTQSPEVLHQIEDFDLGKKRRERERDLAHKKVGELTIAERLTLRAYDRVEPVLFKDRHGEFNVDMHTPLRREYDTIVELQDEMKSGDSKRIMAGSDTFFHMLHALCVDESLNYEFWKNGEYDPMDMIAIIEGLTAAMTKKVIEAQSFRKK